MSGSGTTFTLTRTLTLPAPRVFAAWTRPELLRRWLSTSAVCDAREGGRFRLESASADGTHVVEGVYRELIPARRIVMTWVYRAPNATEPESETLVTVELRPLDERTTELRLHEAQLSGPALEEKLELAAWNPALDQLQVTMTPA
jgi:uncharacterized protein YndB with AHSA1/START domain